ncbi:hypothetical protein ACE38W_08430 [Chitinophaga sp. Hz27]|uniref:hypothetical protein n=1 Tax=Chitinophaga sp. Hz27 TaxID=3347169 RepID=UPI0035D59D66
MKQQESKKKLQLTKIKVANLNMPKQKGQVCMTSVDATTCPGCRLTLTVDCL